jgi:hypothetical protein
MPKEVQVKKGKGKKLGSRVAIRMEQAVTRLQIAQSEAKAAKDHAKTTEGKVEAAKNKVAAAQKALDDALNDAFAELLVLRAKVKKNGKGKPDIDLKALAEKHRCSYWRLWRAANEEGRIVGAVKRGRPSNVSDADIEVAREYVESTDVARDNLGEKEVLAQLMDMAVQKLRPYKSNGQLAMSKRSERKLKQRMKTVEFVVAVALPTDIKRVFTTADKSTIERWLDDIGDLIKRVPILGKQAARWANVDESDKSGRDEKSAKKVRAFTTRKRIRLKQRQFGKRVPLRTRVLAPGHGKASLVACISADANIICSSYLIAAKEVPSALLAPNSDGSDFLPGIGASYFEDTARVRVYATPKGSMTREILATIIVEQILPCWRKRIPNGPLVLLMDAPKAHRPTKRALEAIIKDQQLYLIFFPHNTSHVLQPCDLDLFLFINKKTDEVYRNVVTCSRFTNAYLDQELNVKYKKQKRE